MAEFGGQRRPPPDRSSSSPTSSSTPSGNDGGADGTDIELKERRLSMQRTFWGNTFLREPMEHSASGFSEDNFIKTVSSSDYVLTSLYNEVNKIPGTEIYMFGVDTEMVNDTITRAYTDWDPAFQVFRGDQGIPTHPTYNGPFVRFVQVSTLSGQVFIYDMSKFTKWPDTLHHILNVKHDNTIIVMHDVNNDYRAIHRTFMPCKITWEEHQTLKKRRSQAHSENFLKCTLIDTKAIYENNQSKFNSVGYNLKGNQLSAHLNLAFGQPKHSVPVGGHYWSQPLSPTAIQYLAEDAIGVLDLAVLWLSHDLVPGFSYFQHKLHPNERFQSSTPQLISQTSSGKKKIGRLSSTPVAHAVAQHRAALAAEAKKAKKYRFGRQSPSEDDDELAEEELSEIYNVSWSPTKERQAELLNVPYSASISSVLGQFTPKGVVPISLQVKPASPSMLIAGPQHTFQTDISHVARSRKPSQTALISPSVAYATQQPLSSPTAVFVPSTKPKPAQSPMVRPSSPVSPVDISSDSRLSVLSTQFLNDMNNMTAALNYSLSRDTLTQLRELAGKEQLEYFLESFKNEFTSLLSTFYDNCLSSIANPPNFAPKLSNWTLDFDSWKRTNIATTYCAPEQQYELLCFPAQPPAEDDNILRFWLTSGRVVIETPSGVVDRMGIYRMPTSAITPKFLSCPRYIEPELQQFDGIDKPIALTFLQIQDIFMFLYKFQPIINEYSRRVFRGEMDKPSAPSPPGQVQKIDTTPRHNTKSSALHPFLVGILSLASEDFYRLYKSTQITYVMVEQTRRLLVNLIYGAGRNTLWRRSLAMLNLPAGTINDPDVFVEQLKEQNTNYLSFRQAKFDRSHKQRTGLGQRLKFKSREVMFKRQDQKTRQAGESSISRRPSEGMRPNIHKQRQANQMNRDDQRHGKLQIHRSQPYQTPLLAPTTSVTNPFSSMPPRITQPLAPSFGLLPFPGSGIGFAPRISPPHQRYPLRLQAPPSYLPSTSRVIIPAPPGFQCNCPAAQVPHYHH